MILFCFEKINKFLALCTESRKLKAENNKSKLGHFILMYMNLEWDG